MDGLPSGRDAVDLHDFNFRWLDSAGAGLWMFSTELPADDDYLKLRISSDPDGSGSYLSWRHGDDGAGPCWGELDDTKFSKWLHVPAVAGDANVDGLFTSQDLVDAVASGTYEALIEASWKTGDWNFDGLFDSDDLVDALAGGGYEQPGPTNAVPEPDTFVLLGIGMLAIIRRLCGGQRHG